VSWVISGTTDFALGSDQSKKLFGKQVFNNTIITKNDTRSQERLGGLTPRVGDLADAPHYAIDRSRVVGDSDRDRQPVPLLAKALIRLHTPIRTDRRAERDSMARHVPWSAVAALS
jgi:hypothetical protein